MTTDQQEPSALQIAHPAHTRCVLCGQENPRGFNLAFHMCEDGGVEGVFHPDHRCEGYPNMMHGGIISLLLDGAMTNCLFMHGRTGVTARLDLAFRHPVRADESVTVRAWIERENHPVYRLKARLFQGERLKATANGVFMDRSELNHVDGAT